MNDTILIVDDEKDLLQGLSRSIVQETDYRVITATSGKEALGILEKKSIDLVLTDISMPGIDGLALLKSIIGLDPSITIIMMTAYGSIEIAVKSLKLGAYDFIQKPFNFDFLVRLLKKGMERNRLLRENNRLQQIVCEKAPFENMIGKSQKMQEMFRKIKMLAKTDVTVLITGETGTGKDLAAQAIHAISGRRNKGMITVNCPALPEGLLESELFGHKKGAFTSADSEKKGMFDQAENGTIFLDEIGDLPLSLQKKLLRVLQNQEVKPIGANESHQVNVRVIAATNQDLNQKMENGEFRPDLFYRLHVATLTMPSLREIREDIPLFVNHFLSKSACELQVQAKTVSEDVIHYLKLLEWQGNIRELENLIRSWTATIEVAEIKMNHVAMDLKNTIQMPGTVSSDGSYKELKDQVIEGFTRSYISKLLEETRGNISLSAKISGIKRQSLQKIINRYDIDANHFRGE
ncbi:sigma-54 dependent transcriptional regulator [bacterium]|nr:sigma-54 dependent transcriptional regulator [bacterium]